ncbi:MAG: 3'-5' exonuclease [Planctomycetales bacterium]|nr:3'-5' exonuclease [Planctomycetales bacterium]
MSHPPTDLPRLKELALGTIVGRGAQGASSGEIAALVTGAGAVPDRLAEPMVLSLLGADRRIERGEDGRWRLRAAGPAARGAAPGTTFVVVDVETTGTGVDDRIIEIAAVRVRGGESRETFQSLVDPERELPPFIEALTGITGLMLEGAPAVRAVLPRFAEFLGDAVFVAHNAPFDRRFVFGQAERECSIRFSNPVLCTRLLARRLMPDLAYRGLDAVTEALGVRIADRHRALGDARATAEVLRLFLARLAEMGVTDLPGVLAAQYRKGRPGGGGGLPGKLGAPGA